MRLLRRIICFFGFIAVCASLILGFAYGYVMRIKRDLPSVERYLDLPSPQTSDIFDRNGSRIGCVAIEKRYNMPLEKIIHTRTAQIIVAKEDRRYWEREPYLGGINFILDFYSMARAIEENLVAGKIDQGGSTIVQQTVKQILSPEERSQRNIERKIKEVLLAQKIVQKLSKEQILALYLNELPLGDNTYGIPAAAHHYFSKDVENLNVRESALLAGIIKAPAIFSPRHHPERAKKQLNEALERALRANVITEVEYKEAYMDPDGNEPLPLNEEYDQSCSNSPYAARAALDQIRDKLGLYFDDRQMNMLWDGIRVYTTIDASVQKYAEEAIAHALLDYHNRLGEKAINANGAMVIIENKSGKIIALVGGADYTKNRFNVIFDGERQIGSTIKPLIYSAYFEKLIEKGIPADQLLDQMISNRPFSCRGATRGRPWSPKNFDNKFNASAYTIREAITNSINRCVGWAASESQCVLDFRVVLMIRRLGISTKNLISLDTAVRARLPIAFGGLDVMPLELARAYSVFPNNGVLITYDKMYLVDHITDADGNTLFENNAVTTSQVIAPEIAHTMIEALRNVVTSGTAKTALSKLAQPVAGKTGTTNGYSDAWFCGFTPEITGCVWMGGKDKTESLGNKETGGRVAAPAFKYFVEQYYQGREPVQF